MAMKLFMLSNCVWWPWPPSYKPIYCLSYIWHFLLGTSQKEKYILIYHGHVKNIYIFMEFLLNILSTRMGLGIWGLMPLSTIFQLYWWRKPESLWIKLTVTMSHINCCTRPWPWYFDIGSILRKLICYITYCNNNFCKVLKENFHKKTQNYSICRTTYWHTAAAHFD
jgi:hypothetical protein